jgi:hypothetical protein
MLGLVAAVVAADPLLAIKQSPAKTDEDSVLGVWILNVALSKYTPGPAPKSQTRIYEAHSDGVKATIKTTYADGHTANVEYVAKYDGVEYPLTGSAEFDAIALKKVGARTAEAKLAHGGMEIGTARRVVSPDGKTMTITFENVRDHISYVAVYDRQEK